MNRPPAVKPYGPRSGTMSSAAVQYVREQGWATPQDVATAIGATTHQVRNCLDRHLVNGVVERAYVFTPRGEQTIRESELRQRDKPYCPKCHKRRGECEC